jgi:hypothetical protein
MGHDDTAPAEQVRADLTAIAGKCDQIFAKHTPDIGCQLSVNLKRHPSSSLSGVPMARPRLDANGFDRAVTLMDRDGPIGQSIRESSRS